MIFKKKHKFDFNATAILFQHRYIYILEQWAISTYSEKRK